MATQQALLEVLLKGCRVFQVFSPDKLGQSTLDPTQFRSFCILSPLTLGSSPAQACVTASEADGLMNKKEALTYSTAGEHSDVTSWTSLVVQQLRIHQSVQETWVRSLGQEDATCHRATKAVNHNYWAHALEPSDHKCWAYVPQLLKPTCLEPELLSKRSHHDEKPKHHN